MDKHLLLIINEDKFFLSHRTRIAEMAKEKGWDVTLVTKDTGKREEIERMGFRYVELPINPTGMNLKDEMRQYVFLKKLFKDNPDSIIHLVGLKNIIWGGLASRMAKTRGVLFAVSGLGTLFGEERKELLSKGIQSLIRIGMRHKNSAVIFQNNDDMQIFTENGVVGKSEVYFIKGSGVDLKLYSPSEEKEGEKIRIIFTARMLKEKGVEDLIKAAEILRPEYEDKIEFLLCGDISSNPHALTKEEIEGMTDGKYIRWAGHCDNVPELLSESHIMCFPSYYREGVPKSLLEASAAGLPIVTTDSVGCRDTVEDGKNGFIVPTHSPEKIAGALVKLINDISLRKRMGEYSRQKAEKEYDVERVALKHLEIYEKLLKP